MMNAIARRDYVRTEVRRRLEVEVLGHRRGLSSADLTLADIVVDEVLAMVEYMFAEHAEGRFAP